MRALGERAKRKRGRKREGKGRRGRERGKGLRENTHTILHDAT